MTMDQQHDLVASQDPLQETASLHEPFLPAAEDQEVTSPFLLATEHHHNSSTETTVEATLFSPAQRRRLLLFKVLYFLSGLSGSAWGRYGVIYYNTIQHLNARQIGILQGISPLVSFVTTPLWGTLADCLQSRKVVFMICQIASTILLVSLLWQDGFGPILATVMGMACFSADGVLDAHALDFLKECHQTQRYGEIRLWTAVSWGLGCVVMGYITDRLGFVWNFGLFAGMMTLTLVVLVWGMPARSKSEQARYDALDRANNNNNASSSHEQQRLDWKVLYQVLTQWRLLIWLLEVAVVGAGMSLVESFLFVYLQNDLKASTVLCGYTVGVTVLLELPIFSYSRVLLQHVGHDGLLVAAMLAYAVRVLGYTQLTPDSVEWILLLEVLHGITFGCMWIASVDFAARVAPEEWSTTVQSILSTFLTCVGGGLGPVVGGVVLQQYGAVVLYRGACSVMVVMLLVRIMLWTVGFGHDDFVKRYHECERQGQDDDSLVTTTNASTHIRSIEDEDLPEVETTSGYNSNISDNNGPSSGTCTDSHS